MNLRVYSVTLYAVPISPPVVKLLPEEADLGWARSLHDNKEVLDKKLCTWKATYYVEGADEETAIEEALSLHDTYCSPKVMRLVIVDYIQQILSTRVTRGKQKQDIICKHLLACLDELIDRTVKRSSSYYKYKVIREGLVLCFDRLHNWSKS